MKLVEVIQVENIIEQKISYYDYHTFRNLSCEEELPWNGGSTLLSYISSVKVRRIFNDKQLNSVNVIQYFLQHNQLIFISLNFSLMV